MTHDLIARQALERLSLRLSLVGLLIAGCGTETVFAQPAAVPMPKLEVLGEVRCWVPTPTGLAPQVKLTVRASGPLRLLALSGLFRTANFAPTAEVWATQYHVDQHLNYQLTLMGSQRLQAWPPEQVNVTVSARMVPRLPGDALAAGSTSIQDLLPMTVASARCTR